MKFESVIPATQEAWVITPGLENGAYQKNRVICWGVEAESEEYKLYPMTRIGYDHKGFARVGGFLRLSFVIDSLDEIQTKEFRETLLGFNKSKRIETIALRVAARISLLDGETADFYYWFCDRYKPDDTLISGQEWDYDAIRNKWKSFRVLHPVK